MRGAKDTNAVENPLVGSTPHYLDDAIALPCDGKFELVDDLVLLQFESAEEQDLILIHGSVRVFKNVLPEII